MFEQLRDFSYQRFKPVDDYSPDLFVTWSWSICFLRFFRTNLKFMRICCTKETHSVLYLPKAYKVMRLYSASLWASLYGDESRARRGLWLIMLHACIYLSLEKKTFYFFRPESRLTQMATVPTSMLTHIRYWKEGKQANFFMIFYGMLLLLKISEHYAPLYKYLY